MENKILEKLESKKRLVSATQKGKDDVCQLQDIETNDEIKLAALKDQVIRKVATSKSKRDKFTTKINQTGSTATNVKGQENLELRSEKANIKGKNSLEKKTRPSSEIEISGVGSPLEAKDAKENKDSMETPWKRKRGADAEIMQTYLSSADTNMSRCRPRKEVPAFRLVSLGEGDCFRIVGKRIKVYWPESRRWFIGRIKSFDNKKKHHSILYEDGDKEELELSKERFELEILPSEGFNLRIESKFQKRYAASEDDLASREHVQEESAFGHDAKIVSESSEIRMKTAVNDLFGRKWTTEVKVQEAKMRSGKSVAFMDVALHSELDKELLCHELLDAKESTLFVPRNGDDGSESTEDMSKEVTAVKEAQTGGLEFHSEGKTVCLDERISKSVVTLTYTRRRGASKPATKPTNLKTKSVSDAEISRELKLPKREVSHKVHTRIDEDMKHSEVNMKYVQHDIHVKKDVIFDLKKENDKAFSNLIGKSEENDPVSLAAQGSPLCVNAENMQKKPLASAGSISKSNELPVPPAADVKEKVRREYAKLDEGNSIIQQEKASVAEAEYESGKEITLHRPE
ncbi:hypothetical protein K2173_016355 [Erythroxylum novogranatense]|uniref:PTM/DIR17-like Tudor domain-containing protein n=1 Tax=Erythroxylum novogranatense TaxID=1862640 RepID=A0AAV8SGP0_9ROSI|nr:hypothetical protein K2173_016355 [Erythroxylum novogranatense]